MNSRQLGMYVHTHWHYNHPYAARTWTLDDWRGLLSGLRGLGYDFVQVWPMVDIMPDPLTPSDHAHLARLGSVIDMAHDSFGMKVIVGACANTVGNDTAAGFSFENRPYFVAERKINPGSAAEVDELFRRRRDVLAPLSRADGLWVIDSDPGGYAGSPPEEFVALLGRYRTLLDSFRPGIELIYWMWFGWSAGNRPEESWKAVLSGLKDLNPEPWSMRICLPQHVPVAKAMGVLDRACSFRYNAIENEPSMPWTRHEPERLFRDVTEIPGPRGALGNAQTYAVQLPHVYYFSHFSRGGTPAAADLEGFAERLLPGGGGSIAAAFRAMGDSTEDEINSAARALERLKPGEPGDLGGLLFGSPERFLNDLRVQLKLRAAEQRLEAATSPDALRTALREIREPLAAWCRCHGFGDYGWLTPVSKIGSASETLAIKDVAELFRHGPAEDHRHGFMQRLLEALQRV